MTTSVNAPITHGETVFQDIVWKPVITGLEAWLFGAVPVLALPILKTIVTSAIGMLAGAAWKAMNLFIDVTSIKIKNAQHQSAYEASSLKLQVVLLESGATSDAYIQARQAALDALSTFTNFNK